MAEGERGRPTKLTPLAQKIILMMLEGGTTRRTAAERAGVSPRTLQLWLRLGLLPNADLEYREFRVNVLRAEARAVLECVEIVRKAAHKDWKAAAWWLERHCPEYAKNKTFEPAEDEDELEELMRLSALAEPNTEPSEQQPPVAAANSTVNSSKDVSPISPLPTESAHSPEPVRIPVPATPATPATPTSPIAAPCAPGREMPASSAANPVPGVGPSTSHRVEPRSAAVPAPAERSADRAANPSGPTPVSAPVNPPNQSNPRRGPAPKKSGSHRPARSPHRPLCCV
ncbi:hypothetical protein [Fimbriiglobus ruber]|uniref:Translation initiation factor 2 n=1 Tax=Fimbriiglobus ruber TaxID=1908690 RepID=A0A225E985_9BACT|nr:hypothetical protein [Fimbriiglobus ruber]OWK45155.1 Translation initiation factor 2 [Fimbriiglobus ruber]